jgi:hypothetical protein
VSVPIPIMNGLPIVIVMRVCVLVSVDS